MRGIRSLSLLVLLLTAAGCVRVVAEPALPMPQRPTLRFFQAPGLGVCLSEADADQLLRYVLKLNEFEAARLRLLER